MVYAAPYLFGVWGPILTYCTFLNLLILVTFELHYAFIFCYHVSGSHHSGSPLARGARYCMSADSSKVYTIPQTSSSLTGPEPGQGPSSEACGQARPQAGCTLPVGMKTTEDDDDDAHSTEGPPSISECGWVCVCERGSKRERDWKHQKIFSSYTTKLVQFGSSYTSYRAKLDDALFNHAN